MAAQHDLRIARTAMARGFGSYKKEDRHTVRKVDVKESPELQRIKKAFMEFPYEKRFYDEETQKWDEITLTKHMLVADMLRGCPYSAKEVTLLSLSLLEFYPHDPLFFDKAGFFLTILINLGNDQDYTIYTQNLERGLDFVGYWNRKNIRVIGDIGRCAGEKMTGGQLIIEGNAWHSLGVNMNNGIIIVKGDVDEWCGAGMKGGKITIEGNSDRHLAEHMEGGEIHIKGDYSGIILVNGGKIYHKGKLISANGKEFP